jgi:hypothetical protein
LTASKQNSLFEQDVRAGKKMYQKEIGAILLTIY